METTCAEMYSFHSRSQENRSFANLPGKIRIRNNNNTYVWIFRITTRLTNYLQKQCPSWEANGSSTSLKKNSTFYETRRLYSQEPATCPHSKPDRSNAWLQTHSFIFISILPSHLLLGLPSGLFAPMFHHQNPVCTSRLPRTCYLPAHLILLDLITRIIFVEE